MANGDPEISFTVLKLENAQAARIRALRLRLSRRCRRGGVRWRL